MKNAYKVEENGHYLIRGIDLTQEQKTLITFRGMKYSFFIENHSFWFKDGKPATQDGYFFPICHSLSYLPY
jgi:hypothetical protein